MHDQIGVAPDRRGEMRVAPQVQAEMAVILGGVFGLGLRAQHHFVHQRFGIVPLDLRQHVIEQRGAQRAAFRERQIEGFQKFLQIMNLLERRFIVHPIDKRQRLLFKHFGRRDVGQDHEFFDQLVRIQPLRHDDAIHGAVGLQQDLAFGNVEIERIAFVARALDDRIGVVERFEDRIEQGTRRVVGPSVDRRLRLRVVQLSRPSASGCDESCASACGRHCRSPSAPPARRAARPAPASTDRWRCAPAASAPRDPGNTPNCRASARRGRAPSPAAHRMRRRRSRHRRCSRRCCSDRDRVAHEPRRRGPWRRADRWSPAAGRASPRGPSARRVWPLRPRATRRARRLAEFRGNGSRSG